MKLSKTRYISGIQCEKRLWLGVHRPELASEPDAQLQSILDQGHNVGRLARQLFPSGVTIFEDQQPTAESIRSTEKAVAGDAPAVFEAAAEYENVAVRADVLVRLADGSWDLVEVKSSTQVRDHYFQDLAIQRFVFEGAGYRIRHSILCHVNRDYVREGEIDIHKLFKQVDVTASVMKWMREVPTRLKAFSDILRETTEPEEVIGRHCEHPNTCEFEGYCWKGVPLGSVFELSRGMELAEELYAKGVVRIREIPVGTRLTRYQKMQVDASKSNIEHWNRQAVQRFLERVSYPLYYLDFESFMQALPPFEGTKPYQHIPFQFSVHSQNTPQGGWVHREYLDEGQDDPRRRFSEVLVECMGGEGTILTYSHYEATVLKQLQKLFPDLAKPLAGIVARMLDLSIPFRNGDVLYPEFGGSFSIKKVLPVLVPGMDYGDLEVGHGMEAVSAYQRLRNPKTPTNEKISIRKALLAYCGQDTMALVKLLERMNQEVQSM